MKIDWSFPRQVLVALVILTGLSFYPLSHYGSPEYIRAFVVGAMITTVNVLLGYAAIEYSYKRSATTFFKYVLGGMGVRMMAMVGVLVLLIKVFNFDPAPLVSSLGIFYVVFLTLEIIYIQKKFNHR